MSDAPMNADQQSIDLLAAQECESLAGYIARGQSRESFEDIVVKLRSHADKLPDERKAFWADQAKALGVDLYPPPPEPKKPGKSTKPEASGTP